jgi:hypothetical protein
MHAILNQMRQAVERRAHLLLAQLHEAGDETAKAGDGGGVSRAEGEAAVNRVSWSRLEAE